MATANDEFRDLMPHRIEVTSVEAGNTYDDYGRPVGEVPSTRTYACLLDDTTTTVRTAEGTSINVALTAYVAPVPLGKTEVVDIGSDDSVKILDPYEKVVQVKNIERHYDSEDGVGELHNIVLRFG